MLKANLKQNRIKHLIWIVILVGLFASASTKFNVLFGTQKDIDAIVETLKTPAMVSLFGEFSAIEAVYDSECFCFLKCWFYGNVYGLYEYFVGNLKYTGGGRFRTVGNGSLAGQSGVWHQLMRQLLRYF